MLEFILGFVAGSVLSGKDTPKDSDHIWRWVAPASTCMVCTKCGVYKNSATYGYNTEAYAECKGRNDEDKKSN